MSRSEPRTVTALSKDDVIATSFNKVFRYDGKNFVKDDRAGAPQNGVGIVGRIGQNEAWYVLRDGTRRLAPESKK